jgi:hypothetical protein
MRFEILPGLPPYGPMAISFTKNGAREHREGLVVRFYPTASEPWVGNFIGGVNAYNAVLDPPNETYVIVVARGEACIVDPERRAVHRMAWDTEQVISVPSLRSIIFQSLTDFIAVGADNSGWISQRISWDGFRNVEVHETDLLGEAYSPVSDAWVPFRLDLLTGHCTDGIYEKEIARAVHVSGRKETKTDPSLN